MVTEKNIIGFTEKLSGHRINKDEGVQHGDIDRPLASVTVCWMATPEAITQAGQNGSELIIGHESLYFPYDAVNRTDNPDGWQQWRTNRQRRELLEKYGLTFLRLHGSVDEICIFDDSAAGLGLGEPVYSAPGLVKVYQIEECPLSRLIERVKSKVGIDHVRVSATDSMDRPVSRIGLPWGGLGLFVNVQYQQRLIEQGCDVFIAGEADNYGFRFSAECGIDMIETSHEICENPGLDHFTKMLAKQFPGLDVKFYENPCIWKWC